MPSAPEAFIPTPGLHDRLRSGTHDLHTQAERSQAMQALIRGQMSRDAYAALLRNLHVLYAALEPALEAHRHHPMLAPLHDERLSRCAALESDLRAVHGEDWSLLPVVRTAGEYVERLKILEACTPELLAAHAYVRYLGDLSGGQILLERVGRMLGLEGGEGTRFYEFGEPGATVLAKEFREGLASLPASETDIERLVDEARLSFVLHTRMFDELAPA